MIGAATQIRPRRAWRQRSTRARCLKNASVFCLVHTGVAGSLIASVTDTEAGSHLAALGVGSRFFGAQHVSRIRRGER
jgi:hypothetical protein